MSNVTNHSLLLKSGSGVREDRLDKGARAFASEIARYITCPSTIRSRVVYRYGFSPSLDFIKEQQAKWRARREQFRAFSDSMEAQPDDIDLHEIHRRRAKAKVFHPMRVKLDEPFVPPTMVPDIIAGIASEMGVSAEEVIGPCREKRLVEARWVIAHVLRERGNSFPAIGRHLNRDHSSIQHALKKFNQSASMTMRAIAARYVGGAA